MKLRVTAIGQENYLVGIQPGQVSRFGGHNTFLEGQDFGFYSMFKTNFSGRNKIWGALPPNAPPWLRSWIGQQWFYRICRIRWLRFKFTH